MLLLDGAFEGGDKVSGLDPMSGRNVSAFFLAGTKGGNGLRGGVFGGLLGTFRECWEPGDPDCEELFIGGNFGFFFFSVDGVDEDDFEILNPFSVFTFLKGIHKKYILIHFDLAKYLFCSS